MNGPEKGRVGELILPGRFIVRVKRYKTSASQSATAAVSGQRRDILSDDLGNQGMPCFIGMDAVLT